MKKGFTAVELVFIIVVLGILSAVVLPKLFGTREDTFVARAATNISTFVSDITHYYMAQGGFENGKENIYKMTSVAFPIQIGTNNCLDVTDITQTSITLSISEADLCGDLWRIDSLAEFKELVSKDIDGTAKEIPSIDSRILIFGTQKN
ncbi:type II secretion system protein [Campylobacter californiensis]|uniref:type II secretion system protein n=1 Tax=Campylobacter californiensis TaxID=1032243 RepID=UPI001473A03D|nr:type II secretion system GspH family protein [Campylobacter sp. RM12916]MBE3610580.1 hypothetical protein [Campylobacter sp. RM12916]